MVAADTSACGEGRYRPAATSRCTTATPRSKRLGRRVAEKLAVAGLIAWGWWHPALAAWSGFEQPTAGLCTFGSPLRERSAALVISGRFEVGSGRAKPDYSLVFSANDGIPEITKLEVAVDERAIASFVVVSHVPAASGASAVVALNPETLGNCFRPRILARCSTFWCHPSGPIISISLVSGRQRTYSPAACCKMRDKALTSASA